MSEHEMLRVLVDLVLVVSLSELLWSIWPRRGRRAAWVPGLPNLLSGLSLVLALRLAIDGAAWPWLALCLAAAGVAHGLDLQARWRAGRTR
jgi:hypothetical protein